MAKLPQAWINANVKITANEGALPKWWTDMSDENKKEYIEEHPTSKYADIYKGGSGEAPAKEEPKKEAPVGGESAPKSLDAPEMKPNSPFRKKLGAFLKTKSKNIAHHFKEEVKEWKTAGTALAGLAKGKKMTDHERAAVAQCATDLAVITLGMLTGHAIYDGVKEILTHVGTHVAEEALIKAAISGAVTSASMVNAADSQDKILEDAIKIMMEQIESGDLEAMSKNKKDVNAALDMSADVAGKGMCPECKNPMQILTAGNAKVWACAHDRITLPLPDGYQA